MVKDIVYTGGHANETHPYGFPDLGYATRTKAQAKNTAMYVAIKWLLKLKKKHIEDGVYFYTTVEHFTRRYGAEHSGVFRGYVSEEKGKKILSFSSAYLLGKNVKMTEDEAKRFVQRMSKSVPPQKKFY